jgi:GDP-L-fucose synthase
VLPALIRKIHLGKCLENNDWESIRNDLNKNPINHIDGNAEKQAILDIFQKHGIYTSNSSTTINLWGSGNPRREFLHSDDMADACLYLMENTDFTDLVEYALPPEKKPEVIQSSIYELVTQHHQEIKNTHINIGTGKDISIKELAEMIKDIVGFKGTLDWNTNMPDGTYQKLLNVTKLKGLGWQEKIGLKEGIEKVYTHYKEFTS